MKVTQTREEIEAQRKPRKEGRKEGAKDRDSLYDTLPPDRPPPNTTQQDVKRGYYDRLDWGKQANRSRYKPSSAQ